MVKTTILRSTSTLISTSMTSDSAPAISSMTSLNQTQTPTLTPALTMRRWESGKISSADPIEMEDLRDTVKARDTVKVRDTERARDTVKARNTVKARDTVKTARVPIRDTKEETNGVKTMVTTKMAGLSTTTGPMTTTKT